MALGDLRFLWRDLALMLPYLILFGFILCLAIRRYSANPYRSRLIIVSMSLLVIALLIGFYHSFLTVCINFDKPILSKDYLAARAVRFIVIRTVLSLAGWILITMALFYNQTDSRSHPK